MPKRKKGATLKLTYDRNVFGWPLLGCSRCGELLKRHYYVHQCNKLPHHWCYNCLEEKGKCSKCHLLFRSIYHARADSNMSSIF